ncbi:MAG: DNA protecting protein DprA [Sphingobacteriales bacterium 50-39]|nr:DNA-processing protein DprA [Sphingobacteriales bacterium]OJW60513.1 MAG: DNA protecting protein DprA [Sphingobacteriales bacterium 50-39]
MEKELLYQLALGRIPGIGPVYTRRLLHHFDTPSAIFHASSSTLEKVFGLGSKRANDIARFTGFTTLEEELAFIEKYSIRPLFITDRDYPQRLLRCPDAPILLFFKGTADLNASKVVAIIGTRSPSEYGRQATERLIRDMASIPDILIISGLAYGIDAVAHQAALQHHIPTIGVLGHGLDQLYPREHTRLARNMLREGGLLTKFTTGTKPDAYNFPIRNRIVAGMSDAVIVTETRSKGGSLLTAENALVYHRKVFAIPGRINDEKSSGCNALIREGKARLLTDTAGLQEQMCWEIPAATSITQQGSLFSSARSERPGLSDNERTLLQLFDQKKTLTLTDIHTSIRQDHDVLSVTLLNLELLGHISSLPGKTFRLVE